MLACGMLLASIPTRAAGVDVVDIVRVIDASSPGKAGQEYIDEVRGKLDAKVAGDSVLLYLPVLM